VDWKEYGYLGVLNNTGVIIYRPYVTICIQSGDKRISVDALVDSGSDGMVIHAGLAKDLGIDQSKCPPKSLSGATGVRDGFTSAVSYEVDGFRGYTIKTTAIFVPDLPVACLIGQEDFFEKFIVQFKKHNNVLRLSKIPKKNS